MKGGVAVDDWKLPVFRRRLTAAGFEYQDGGPLLGGCTLLTVQTDDPAALQKVLEAAQAECRKAKAR